jgi:hypothetical protein
MNLLGQRLSVTTPATLAMISSSLRSHGQATRPGQERRKRFFTAARPRVTELPSPRLSRLEKSPEALWSSRLLPLRPRWGAWRRGWARARSAS